MPVIFAPIGIEDGDFSPRFLSLGKKAKIDSAKYSKFSNWFNLDLQSKDVDELDLVLGFEKSIGVSFSEEERSFLAGVFAVLPEEFRKVRNQNGINTYVFNYMNLLPLINDAVASFNSSKSSKDKKDVAQVGQTLAEKMRDFYINQQLELLNTSGNQQQLMAMSPEERRKLANELVNSSDESPASRGQIEQTEPAEGSTTSEFEKIISGAGFVPSSMSGGGDLMEMDDWLRLNPESSILDIAKLEDQGQVFSQGFSMAGILDPNGRFTVKDTDGKVKSWTASDAVKLIYDLREKGETKKIIEIQEMMVKAGYYMDTRPIRGIVDETTVAAWNLFLTDAARNNQTPKNQFLRKVSEREQIRSQGLYVSQQDPVAVEQFVQETADRILGRKLSLDEVRLVTKAVRDWEQKAITSGLSSSDPVQYDFEARINRFIAEQNKVELELQTKRAFDQYYKEVMGI